MTTPHFLSSEVCFIYWKAEKLIIHQSQVLTTDSPTQAHFYNSGSAPQENKKDHKTFC